MRRCEQAQGTLAAARHATEGARERARRGWLSVVTRAGSASAELADAYVRDMRGHLRGATELELADPAGAFGALEAWLQALSAANPIEQAISSAGP